MDKFQHLMEPETIFSAVIMNPIELGNSVNEKHSLRHIWASLFKASTWEEINMLAERDVLLERQDALLAEKDAIIRELRAAMEERPKEAK